MNYARLLTLLFIANSGAEGLEMLRANDVSVVVSDVRMPQMTGTEFLKRVHKGWPDTFRVLLTGYADMETVTAGVNEAEIHRFLAKPWNQEELKLPVTMGFERENSFVRTVD
ncbi:MAG: response regulator RpfG family c-di-GMP phosphodiesterase [Candidatus Latescibacterota bacterium]|jgi:response regulator RpfG family c-di-GMP phosphodiesterase